VPSSLALAPDAIELNDDNASDPNFVAGTGNDLDSSSEESVEDENVRQVHLLDGVVCTNEDHGLGNLIVLLDPLAAALATFEAAELQALMFLASCSVICGGGFTEVNSPICFRCLR
jgi:hypothetical protein